MNFRPYYADRKNATMTIRYVVSYIYCLLAAAIIIILPSYLVSKYFFSGSGQPIINWGQASAVIAASIIAFFFLKMYLEKKQDEYHMIYRQ